jgi:hypothetical protein
MSSLTVQTAKQTVELDNTYNRMATLKVRLTLISGPFDVMSQFHPE